MTNSLQSKKRSGKVLRTVVGVLGLMILVTGGLLMLLLVTRSSTQAQTVRPPRDTRVVVEHSPQPAIQPGHSSYSTMNLGDGQPIGRPMVAYPVGRRFTYVIDSRVMQLATELRGLSEDDEQRAPKLKQLTDLLEAEFAERHERQAEQIAKAAEQLESLQTTHNERLQRKDEIVQRRIESLIGQPDVLQWAPNLPPIAEQPSADPRTPSTPARVIDHTARPATPAPATFPDPIPHRSRATTSSPPPARGDPQPIDPRSIRSDPPTRIEVSATPSGDVFAVVRRLSTAVMSENSAKILLDRATDLHKKNAIPENDLLLRKMEHEKARRDSLFAFAEFEAFSQRLVRELEFAKTRLASANQVRDLVKSRVENGTVSTQELLEQQAQVAIAEKNLIDAEANVDHLKKARSLIGEREAESDPFDGTPKLDRVNIDDPD